MEDGRMAQHLQVLVVDDEMIVATAIEELLASAGHSPTVALGVEEALTSLDGMTRLDAAIVDLQLPDGSGAGLIEEIRRRWPALPVVISTGYALDAEDRASLGPGRGGAVLLKKPWTEAELLSTLGAAVAAR
jgi:CheY-like chemotaxis protein